MNYTDLLDYVMPDVPGCSVDLAVHHIRNACVELCQEALCYRHRPTDIDIVSGTRDYTLSLPADTCVVAVLHAIANDAPIYPKTDAQLDSLYEVYGVDWRDIDTTGDVAYYQMTDPAAGTIRLILTPDESVTAGLEVELALEPAVTSTSAPDWLLTRYRSQIAHGAKAALFAMAKKPWTNPDLAVFHMARWNSAKGSADAAAAKGHTRAPLRVRTSYR